MKYNSHTFNAKKYSKYASLNKSHRNYMNRKIYQKIFKWTDCSLHFKRRISWNILSLLGIFMPQGCAERRGNKITGSYGQFTRSKKTLSFVQFLPLNLISPNIHINFPRLISIPLSWKDFIKIKAIPSCWSVILLEIVMMGLILWKIMSQSQEPS